MNALLLKEYKHLEMVEMPQPEIGLEDVLIRVRTCGICGSDVHGLDGSTGRRIPPLVMGHEAAGEVVETGPEAAISSPATASHSIPRSIAAAAFTAAEARSTSAITARCLACRPANTGVTARLRNMSPFRGASSTGCPTI